MSSFLSDLKRAFGSPFALINAALAVLVFEAILRIGGVGHYSVWSWMWVVVLLLLSVATNVARLFELGRIVALTWTEARLLELERK